jgi:hypothetical protein
VHNNTGKVAVSIKIETMKAEKKGINSQIVFRKYSPLDPNLFHYYFDMIVCSHNSKYELAVIPSFLLAGRLEIVIKIEVEFQFE